MTGDQQTKAKIDSVETSARRLATSNPTVKLAADDAVAAAKIAKVEDRIAALNRARADPKIDADIAGVERSIMLVEGRLARLQETKTGIELQVETAKAEERLAALRFRLDELSSKRISIDVDVAAAEAQLAALKASADDAGSSADSAAPKFSAMGAAIFAAFPPASAAVLGLSGALLLAVDPLVAIKVGMTGIQAAAAPLAGEFLNLQSVVGATFEQGLKPAITDISALMPTLTAGLVGTAGALTTVAQQVGAVVSSQAGLVNLQTSFSNIQSIIAGMAPGISGLVQNFLDLGAMGTGALSGLVGIVNGLAAQWHTLVTELTSSGVAQVAIQSLVGALGAVAAWIPPVVSAGAQLMAVLGPPLVGALQLVGGLLNLLSGPLGGLTMTVLAGVAAWKLLGPAVAATEGFLTGVAAKFGLVATAEGAAAVATAAYDEAVAASGVAAANAATAQAAYDEAVAAGLPATAEATALSEANALATGAQGRAAAAAAESNLANAAAMRGAAASNAVAGGTAGVAAVSTGAFATALRGVGSAILPVGIAVAAGYVAMQAFTTTTDEAVAAMEKGGQAAADMSVQIKEQSGSAQLNTDWFDQMNNSFATWVNTNIRHMATADGTTQKLNEMRAAMSPLELATSLATEAQGNYTKAVKDYTANSPQAADAQKKLADATLKVSEAQSAAMVSTTNIGAAWQAAALHSGADKVALDGLAQSTVSYANALASLAQPMASAADITKAFAADMANAADAPRNLLSAMDAASKSLTSFDESTVKITPALVDASGAINTATKAGQDLATGILGTAKAYDNLRGATIASSKASGDDLPTQLAKGGVALEDFRQKLIEEAVQHGATRDAAKAMIDTYLAIPPSIKTEISQPGMAKAYADSLGLTSVITAIPTDKTVVVKSLSDEARKKLEDLGFAVKTLPNGQIIIGADIGQVDSAIALMKQRTETMQATIRLMADPVQFNNSVHDGVAAAQSLTPRIPVGATMDGYYNSVRDGVGAAQSVPAVVPVNGNPAQFYGVVESSRALAGATLAVIPMDGAPALFEGKVTQSVTLANGSVGTIALDGNPALVNGKTTTAVQFADGSKGTITLDGNPNPATGKIDGTVTYADGKTGRISVDANTAAANAAIDYAARPRTSTITVSEIYLGSSPAAVRAAGAGGGIVGGAGGGLVGGAAVHMATGGVLGGYAPGVDNIPAILSPGEAVLVPELTRALGPANILAANLEASGRAPTFWNGARPVGGDGAALGGLNLGGRREGPDVGAVLERFGARIERVQQQAAQQVAALTAELRRSGAGASIVVNDASGNPVETARSTMLQLRMRR